MREAQLGETLVDYEVLGLGACSSTSVWCSELSEALRLQSAWLEQPCFRQVDVIEVSRRKLSCGRQGAA